jgi:ribosomal protein S25
MGGTKKKTLAGMEKEQAKRAEEESQKKKDTKQKGKKGGAGGAQPHLTFVLRDEDAMSALKGMKAITVYSAAKSFNVKASVASATLRNLEAKGMIKKVGRFSGHYVYSIAN